ncbi:HupE/UreJ family protein [uncultured Paraglaciecola sp.]|uniref:HupE/UreJ family protein n=1 Tax=uncultured Paraglaciecola sp. TaxID=1765024 RepID=UPI0030DA3E02
MKHLNKARVVKAFLRYFTAAILICLTSHASAHQMSTGYLNLDTSDKQVNKGQIQLRWFDLDNIIGLDANTDGQLLWGEVQQRQSAIIRFLKQHLIFVAMNQPCELSFSPQLQMTEHFNEGYLAADFSWSCPNDSSQLTVNYSGVFQQDSDHKLLINAEGNTSYSSGVIENSDDSFVIDLTQTSAWQTFTLYVYQGVLHIFMGIDHILFLIALLLTCALSRENKQWSVALNNKSVFKNAAWIVTAFTLAHSLTLTATAMELITPNSRWVELGIAISVLLTALNNIWPIILRLGWITFAFGLLHGMGFAGVLGELGLAKDQKLLSVLSFNLGVEFGQLMILVVVLPLLILVSKRSWYQQYGVKVGSGLIALIALSWSIQRF